MGDMDLFKVVKLSSGWDDWSYPENLGNVINGAMRENVMCISAELITQPWFALLLGVHLPNIYWLNMLPGLTDRR
jgi:hypothetical protein